MNDRTRLVVRLTSIAVTLTGVAALVGLLDSGVYRDRQVLVDATRADNAFQLLLVVPLLAAVLVAWRRGSVTAVPVVLGGLMYLAYFFGLYALAGAPNAMTLVHIAVVGLATWALVLGLPAVDAAAVEASIGARLLRRSTVAFLLVVAGFHIPLWAGQILGSVASATTPAALVSFGWLTSPVYTFDLAFAMPLGIVAAVLLARRDPRGSLLAVSFAWFSLLLAADMFVEQLWFGALGDGVDPAQALPFGAIAIASALVLAPTVLGRSRPGEIPAQPSPST